ncbi:hypothetical protein ADIWIN_2557 [Winogradskyella psychrotolerans RS-3]|uniref:Uncharacterized protein n=1 Tax=Winogradskyella psychrotolerans RS-3 TaxID=641526 RepID=S7VSP6_9FLAO|nr:hypothetical protein ADIWIN_2557 [Winogradskyella psychrotolerans RS-3]
MVILDLILEFKFHVLVTVTFAWSLKKKHTFGDSNFKNHL